jgi:hypothetical protein
LIPIELLRFQIAMAIGTLEVQQKLMSGAWQAAMWWMPRVTTTESGGPSAPVTQRRAKE